MTDETANPPSPAPPNTMAEPLIRANILLPVADALTAQGVPVEGLLDRYVGSWRIHNTYQEIPLRDYIAFFEEAATLADQPFLGLQMGADFRPENLGNIGGVFRAARDLHSALARLSSYLDALRPGIHTEIILDRDHAYFGYRFDDPTIRPRRQDVEFSMAATVSFIRALMGPGWAPVAVHLDHPAPQVSMRRRQIYHKVFRSPVFFNQPGSQLVLRHADLKETDLSGRRAAAPSLEQNFREIMAQAAGDESIARQVRYVVALHMGNAPLTVAAVAAELGLSSRTLQRRLGEEGTTLRQLVREQRQQTAEALLARKTVPVSSVADNLGYGDPAELSRAFKTWTGASPSRFRSSRKT
jgi:AraC-like DNA-binding protein